MSGRAALLALLVGCASTAPAPSNAPRPPQGPVTLPPNGIVGEYDVTYDGKKSVWVYGTMGVKTPVFEVEEGADAFLSELEGAPLREEKWVKPTRQGAQFVFAPCVSGPCRIRYRASIRSAGKKIDELEVASEEGDVVIAPPSSWLLTAPRDDDAAKVRFRVKTEKNTTFVTGVYRSPDAPDAWDITLSDLWTAPYSAFGPFRTRTTTPKGARIDVAIGPGKFALSDDEILAWVETCERAIVGYFGTFPAKEAALIFVAGRGRMPGEGKTLSGGGGAIFMRLGTQATPDSLANDWVLTHEMVHLNFPTLPRQHHWAEEGVATYVEPFARARIGTLSVEEAWKGLVEGVPNGEPEKGDEGLDRTHTWGRTYWGGALYFLAADVAIRKQSANKFGLEHALRGINAAGGTGAVRWPIEDTMRKGDAVVGGASLLTLYEKMGKAPTPVDLDAMWKDLGVKYAGGRVTFDDTAPSAAIRKAITTPN